MSDTIHALKTWPRFFTDIITGRKTFEVRKNDRGFKERDVLDLVEWDPETQRATGRHAFYRVTYILDADSGLLPEGQVVMAILRDHARMGHRAYHTTRR